MAGIETEIKLIIEKPGEEALREMAGYTESRITQIYVEDPKLTHRVRRREYSDGRVVFTENTKARISYISSVENEREITEEEYLEISKRIERGASPLFKTRRTFEYSGRVVEIDYYREWQSTAILEVELESENEHPELPPFIKVLRDVTGDKKYSNHSMAHSFPDEIV